MKAYLQVFPAYGRTYASASAAVKDFLAGKDFSCSPRSGPYTSIRDFGGRVLSSFDGVQIQQFHPVFIQVVVTKRDMKAEDLSGPPEHPGNQLA